MSWNFDRFLKSQIGLIERLTYYRKAIRSLKTDLTKWERESVEEMIYGFGWMADADMRRVPETNCISIMLITSARIVIGAGELTTRFEYHLIANCFWNEGDFCLEFNEKSSDAGGIRFEPTSRKWTEPRRTALQEWVLQHVKKSSFLSPADQEEINKASKFSSLATKIIRSGISELKGQSEILDQVISHPDFHTFALVVALYAAHNVKQKADSPIKQRLFDIMIDGFKANHPDMRAASLNHFDFLGRLSERFEADGLPFDGEAIKTASGMWILTSLGYAKESEFDPKSHTELAIVVRKLGEWIYLIFMSYWDLYEGLTSAVQDDKWRFDMTL